MAFDQQSYLERIGWRGVLGPDFASLAALLRRHMLTIPFENLDVLLGRPVLLDIESLQAKLVAGRRGGYCYEHATLFAAALQQFGFSVHLHSARVIMATPKASAPRTHMLLSVDVPEGRFVVDPGFGGLAPLVPLPIDGTPMRHGEDEHWIAREGDDYIMRARTPAKTIDAWVTTLTDEFPIDFVMANHFTSTYPSSAFTRRLMMRAFTPGGRITVVNRDVTHWRGSTPRPTQLADREALRELCASTFGFRLDVTSLRVPSIPEWE